MHLCKITAIIECKKLAHTWQYENISGDSNVTWELFPEGQKTKVRLTHTGLETFPKDNKDFAKESFAHGWTHIVGTLLKDFVEK